MVIFCEQARYYYCEGTIHIKYEIRISNSSQVKCQTHSVIKVSKYQLFQELLLLESKFTYWNCVTKNGCSGSRGLALGHTAAVSAGKNLKT